MPDAPMLSALDVAGHRFEVGARVAPVDPREKRIPVSASQGTVTGFGPIQVHVQWDGFTYSAHRPFHYVSRPERLRLLDPPSTSPEET